MGNDGPGGVRFPYFFPLDGRSPVSHPTCEVPFPPRRSGEYWKGMIPSTIFPSCVFLACHKGRTESGGIVFAANAGPRVPSGGVTLKRRCTYRPSVIYLIVNKLLSLSLSLSFSPSKHILPPCLEGGTYPPSLLRLVANTPSLPPPSRVQLNRSLTPLSFLSSLSLSLSLFLSLKRL